MSLRFKASYFVIMAECSVQRCAKLALPICGFITLAYSEYSRFGLIVTNSKKAIFNQKSFSPSSY
jgi:hypothetical protein